MEIFRRIFFISMEKVWTILDLILQIILLLEGEHGFRDFEKGGGGSVTTQL